jgi:phosphoribosylaminoimidazolecarboxamide formyltransferase / IMP cyclohydrolase
MKQRNALLSVYDKEGIVDFALGLINLNWDIYASGGTAAALAKAHVPVKDVAELVGGAILGHRVVTLSREIHAGLLAQNKPSDLEELQRLGVPYIDLACVDLYPLTEEIAKPDATLGSVIEKTDIGGPTMLRSAAKGERIVIANADQRQPVLDWLSQGEPDSAAFRRRLAAIAEARVAAYTLASAQYLSHGDFDGFVPRRHSTLKYGENAWQAPAHFMATGNDDPLALDKFELIAGTPPSYNNLAEIHRQLQTITHIAAGFERNFGNIPCIAVGTKHGNPCGAAVADTPTAAIRGMVTGDTRAIFGGLVMLNFEVTDAVAEALLTHAAESGRRLLDAVAAPAFAPTAIERLTRKGDKCRFLANPALASLGVESLDSTPIFRPVRGGFLRQPNYTHVLDLADPAIEKTGALTAGQKRDLVLAWAIGSTSNSNTVTLTKAGRLIGNGVGQQDRVSCCELAIKRATDAGHKTAAAVAFSDSFFPFADGPAVLAKAGIKAIWATSGSVRDSATRALCREHGVTLWQLPDAAARGFFGH